MTSNAARNDNPMLPVVQQWLTETRGAPPPNRWCAWSANRIGRGVRVDAQRRRSQNIFLRGGRATLIRSATNRQTIAPQWHLTLHPVLLTIQGNETSKTAQRRGMGGVFPRPHRPGTTLVAAMSQRRAPLDMTPRASVARGDTTPVSLDRSRRELRQYNDAGARQFTEVVNRIVRSHQRVETPVHTTSVIRERTNVAMEVERALTSTGQRLVPAQLEPDQRGSPWSGGNGFGMPNPTELDRLTDQIVTRIDDRLTAHRERLGKVF